MCRSDLMQAFRRQQRGECPNADDEEHRTVERLDKIICPDCDRVYLT